MKRVEDHNIYILHTYPFKETSLIVEALSENFGRISLLAKGARRPRSLLRGYLQPFQMIQATWSNVSDLKTLYNVEWNSKYLGLKNQALICGFYMNELIMKLLPKDESSNDFFNAALLTASFSVGSYTENPCLKGGCGGSRGGSSSPGNTIPSFPTGTIILFPLLGFGS